MNNTRRLVTGYAIVFGFFLLGGDLVAAERPNVLLILCDDLGYSDLGCYGGEIQTPNLDRLAAEGMRFSQFYNCAVCVTTRSALLTGLSPRQTEPPRLRTNMITLGEALQRAGYATSLTGKWHLGSTSPRRPIDRGFDEYYGVLSGCCNFFNPAKADPVFYNGGQFRPFAHNDQRIKEFPDGYYTTDAFTNHAIETITRFAKGNEPFFVHLCYTAPHFPLHAFPEDIARYRGKYSDGYLAMRKRRHKRQAELGLFESLPKLSAPENKKGDYRYDYDVPDWENLSAAERKREEARMETYAAMVDRMDRGIGRVLKALDETGVADNTVVMFLSDNGGCASWPSYRKGQETAFEEYNKGIPVGDGRGYEFVGKGWGWAQNAPFRQFKTWCYEGGIATPMIVRWPGKVSAGSITHQVGHIIDFMPTLLELAGSEYPREFKGNTLLPLEGESLLPIFHGKQREGHASLSWELYGNRAIRQGDWKLVWGASEKRWELYNLKRDRSETNNLAAKFPDRVAKMARDWEAWQEKVEK
ncbi:MAG: arylsulfatase, partial [Planctomycetaceae bacterium]|nr:arylsulfatase [Planctomycetaceae bacterium]